MKGEVIPAGADAAHKAQTEIVEIVRTMQRGWVMLAERLYYFDQGKMWADLGYDSCWEWLASPEIGIGRAWFYELKSLYKDFVIGLGATVEQLQEVPQYKLEVTKISVRNGWVPLEQALADAASLSLNDLKVLYNTSGKETLPPRTDDTDPAPRPGNVGRLEATKEPLMVRCTNCGSYVPEGRLRDDPGE